MKTVINVKTEKNVKIHAQKLAKEMGFSLSAIINAYLKQFVRNKEVYFTITPKMSPELENLLGKVEFDIQRNRNISRIFSSNKEIKKHFTSL
ncbi:type II toxin-antitoxin system RelB/DinJ family antitoxin [Patescibacteria group bacterium]|nr:type II toxin-antitoxin system RelB/DinJ family antitoxin [Patescibacteria group bacterium]